MPMPAFSESRRTVDTSHCSSPDCGVSMTCAPVVHLAIGLEMASEMNAPPKPMRPAKIARLATLSPLSARKRSAPRRDAVMVSTTITAMLVTISRKMRFIEVSPFSPSERDVVLEVVELAPRFGSRFALGFRPAGGGALRGGLAIGAAHPLPGAQHLHDVGDDLGRVLVGSVLVLPLARLEPPFHVHLAALLEVFAGDLGELAEEGHAVPLGLLLHLAVLVLPLLGGGDADVGDRAALGHVARFRVAPEVADEDDLVHGCHVRPFNFARPT